MTEVSQIQEDRKPITEHLDELRRCIIRSGIAIFIFSIIAYFFSSSILDWLTAPIQNEMGRVYFFSPTDAFVVRLKTALFSGCVIASPFVLHQVWNYVSPGLYSKEKKVLLPWSIASWVLFLIGIWFAFEIVLPVTLNFLLGFQTSFMSPMISVNYYLSFAISLILSFGIAFDFPIFILALVHVGLLKPETLSRFRKQAYVFVFVAAMFLTPPDMISQVLLAIPLLVLFEVSVIGHEDLLYIKGQGFYVSLFRPVSPCYVIHVLCFIPTPIWDPINIQHLGLVQQIPFFRINVKSIIRPNHLSHSYR